MPPNISKRARANISAALGLFGPFPANQYRALDPVRHRLETALRETPDLPTALFDACIGAVRLTQGQARQGNLPLPEQDVLIEEFLIQLRNTAADMFANDEGTRAAMANRGHVADDKALIAVQSAVVEIVAKVVPETEGLLQVQLPEDAVLATDANADPEGRRNGAFRLASRLLRMGWLVTRWPVGVAATALTGKVAIDALAPVFASPAYQLLLKAIWAMLGLG